MLLQVCIGYLFIDEISGLHPRAANQWLQGCKWAAITCVVVTAPVLGKVAQVSLERTLGTVSGGLLGLLVVSVGSRIPQLPDIVLASVSAGLVGFVAAAGGWFLGLDYSAKLFVLTFVLVVMGAQTGADAALVAVTRISGIVLGVFLSLIMSATDNMAAALCALADLSELAWNRDVGSRRSMEENSSLGRGTGYQRIQSKDNDQSDREWYREQVESREAECEKVLMDVYNKLNKSQEYMPLSENENYIATIRGRWCFVPGISYLQCSKWELPKKEMADLATAVRKLARVLWALHVTFQQGFEEDIMSVLRKRYPPRLMEDLKGFSHEAIEDLVEAFPDKIIARSSHLHRFLQARPHAFTVQELIKVSDQQRTKTMTYLREIATRSSREPSFSVLSPEVMTPMPGNTPTGAAGMPFGPTAPMAICNQVAGSAPSAVHKALSEAAELSPQQKAATTELQHTNGIRSPSSGHLDSIGEVPGPGQHAARALNDGASGQAGRKETSDDGEGLLLGRWTSEQEGPPTPVWKGRQMRSSSQDPSRDMQALPSLRLQQFSEGDEDGYPVITRDTDPAEVADRVDAFPVSSKGYISKVRWFSFQFLMQQLADELNDAHIALSNVLAGLPTGAKITKPEEQEQV
eukprot:jgi/Astpho2/7742/fgenesh1_pg.00116_%23_10_t